MYRGIHENIYRREGKESTKVMEIRRKIRKERGQRGTIPAEEERSDEDLSSTWALIE